MQRLLVAAVLILVGSCVPPALAQGPPEFSGSFVAGIPKGDFARHLSAPGFGVGGYIGDQIPGLPLSVGLDGVLLLYGLDSRDAPFEEAFREEVDAFTTHGIGMAHFVVRLQDRKQTVSPYADLLIGAKYLFTDTKIDGERWDYFDDPLRGTVAFDDVAFSYGMGGGIRFQWLATPAGHHGPRGRITLHAGIRYLFGSKAHYLVRGANFVEDGELLYEAEESRTDMLVPQLGFTVSMW